MSLGIIVTLFACMVTEVGVFHETNYICLCSFLQAYYSAPLEVQVIFAHFKGYLAWTNCKKGSFQIRSSVLFWNCQISQRATVPGQYFLVFFTFPAWRNSFWGALPPMVGWSFLLAGSSLPNIDGLASTAIWANCWVSEQWGWPPYPLKLLCLCNSPHYLLCLQRGLFSWSRGCTSDKGLFSLVSTFIAALVCSIFISPPLFPWWGVTFVLAILEDNQGALANRKTAWLHSCENYMVAILNL